MNDFIEKVDNVTEDSYLWKVREWKKVQVTGYSKWKKILN
jgi:hypothetical protein